MKPSLQAGVSMTRRVVIDRDRTIGFMGEDARVYATPSMIMDIERTCRDLIMEHSDAGLDLAVHQTLAHGGTVWAIRNAEEPAPADGIGALLRF